MSAHNDHAIVFPKRNVIGSHNFVYRMKEILYYEGVRFCTRKAARGAPAGVTRPAAAPSAPAVPAPSEAVCPSTPNKAEFYPNRNGGPQNSRKCSQSRWLKMIR
ncbi:Protein of unknown function [Gryllus bimaculatus]|nr:Protein of unknown function [Gryllus bimaculatus]